MERVRSVACECTGELDNSHRGLTHLVSATGVEEVVGKAALLWPREQGSEDYDESAAITRDTDEKLNQRCTQFVILAVFVLIEHEDIVIL